MLSTWKINLENANQNSRGHQNRQSWRENGLRIDKNYKFISRLPVDRVVEVFGEGKFLTVEITDKMASRGVSDGFPCIFGGLIYVLSYEIKIIAILGVLVIPRQIEVAGTILVMKNFWDPSLSLVFHS